MFLQSLCGTCICDQNQAQKLLHACWLGHFLLVQERELVLALAEAEAEAGHVEHQEKKLQS